MGLGVLAGLVLGDLHVEVGPGHVRLHPAVAEGAAVVPRQLAVDDVRDDVGEPHGQTAHGVGLDVLHRLEVVVLAGEPPAELVGAVHHELGVADEVQDVGSGGGGQQHGRRGGGVDHPVPGVQRDAEERARTPLEGLLPALALVPHLGGAAPLHHVVGLFVEMALGVERARAGDLHHVHAPEVLGAQKLDGGAAPAQAFPRRHGQVLDLVHPDVPMDGDSLILDETVVGRLGVLPLAEAGFAGRRRLVEIVQFRAGFHSHDVLLGRCRRDVSFGLRCGQAGTPGTVSRAPYDARIRGVSAFDRVRALIYSGSAPAAHR